MPDEITQSTTADAPPSPEATAGQGESSGVSKPEPTTTEAPVQQVDSPPEEIFQTPQEQSVPVPENSQPEQISEPAPEPNTETSTEQNNPNVVIEKTPDSVTITEVMQPEPKPKVSRLNLDTQTSKGFLRGLLPKLREKLGFRTEKRLAKIVEFARKKYAKIDVILDISNNVYEKSKNCRGGCGASRNCGVGLVF